MRQQQTTARWFGLVWTLCAGATWYAFGCGSAAPSSSSTPVPIELPSSMSLPSAIGISVTDVRASSNEAVPLAKAASVAKATALPGDTDAAKVYYFHDQANTKIDAIFALFADITFSTSSNVTSASGTLSDGSSYTIDFTAFTNASVSNRVITSVDPTATCSGHTGTLPICVRAYINGRIVLTGIITGAINSTQSSKGAGLFRSVSGCTAATTAAALVDGSGCDELTVVFDQTDTNSRQLEFYRTTNAADPNGVTVRSAHTYAKQETSDGVITVTGTNTASYSISGSSADTTVSGIWVRESSKVKLKFTLAGQSVSEECRSTTSNSTTTDCVTATLPDPPAAVASTDTGISSDTTAPSVSSTSPTASATFVDVTSAITATFSEAMDSSTITTSTMGLTQGSRVISGTVSYNSSTKVATFTPTSALSTNTTYTLSITTGVKDSTGNAMASAYSSSFTTGRLAISAGFNHTLFLKTDGTVWAVGLNDRGEIGDGTTTNRTSPVQVSSLTQVIAVSACNDTSLALKTDGTVWAWGADSNVGMLGQGSSVGNKSTPQQISTLSGITAIACVHQHALALKSDGTVWAWGSNTLDGTQGGQLGQATTTTSNATPTQVSSLSGITVTAIAAGFYHSMALASNGTVYAWGSNGVGQLGNNTTTSTSSAVTVSGLTTATAIAASGTWSMALRSDSTVVAWGDDTAGQNGNGDAGASLTPTAVLLGSQELPTVMAITAGSGFGLALLNDGTIAAWGDNDNGQLGDGTTTNRTSAVQISSTSISNVVMLDAGLDHSVAIIVGGLRSWGENNDGELGLGDTTDRSTPTSVPTF